MRSCCKVSTAHSMDPYDFSVAKVVEAGERILQARDTAFTVLQKGGDPRDVVTSVDLEINAFLAGEIQKTFPTHRIYSEEGGNVSLGDENLWTIDPIDGSSNFSRGIPHFAVCLGLLQAGIPVAGAVYNPVTRELFSFRKGGGAFLNGKPISVSKTTELKEAFVLLHAGRKESLREWGGHAYRQLLEHAKKTSNLAGSALDMCFVAAGRVEANIYGTASLLDIAAAVGILYEAGGQIVNDVGEHLLLAKEPQRIIATNNRSIAETLRTIL
jgi:myo-inositol-1(or 4)-monophosphatase